MACSLVGDLLMAPGSTSSRVGTITAGNVVQMIMTQSSTGSRLIGMIMACSLVDIMMTPTNARSLITAAIRHPPRSLVDIVVTPLMDRRTGKQDTPRSLVDIVVAAVACSLGFHFFTAVVQNVDRHDISFGFCTHCVQADIVNKIHVFFVCVQR